ncbi:hypothetical protein [Candidatus Poriferisodalis sp.]|uniref:hypothetical protein n=1 Tax=Candidatus Poriferisodalis sp. TaxID=3101277 RepID=UPI003B01300F
MLIVDTSVLFEARSRNEAHHGACRDLLRSEEWLIVPAPVVAVAERMGATRVAALNHRDFAIVRPSHTPRLELLPEQATRH